MPWCEDCERFYTPSTLTPQGDCPSGHHVADPDSAVLVQSTAPGRNDSAGREKRKVKAPWHFWVLVAAVVIYLGWRLVQGIAWLLS
ncbi:MAG: hypothetical protein M9942_12285 [Microthrixaceae bacterium]|nr:hypothetical protein [Microthrixaceae bacterium]